MMGGQMLELLLLQYELHAGRSTIIRWPFMAGD